MSDDLDRVLEGLGRVEVPLGLEGRVLRALATREPAPGFAWGWMTVMALVFAGSFVGWKNFRAVGFADTPPFHEAERMGRPELENVVVGRGRAVVARGRRRGASARSGASCGMDLTQDDDLYACSGPITPVAVAVPVAELTDEERLLLRLARRANGGTLAMFDPAIREERAAAEKAEFEFFNPQPAVVTAEPEETDHAVPGKQ